ncbi:phosphatidylglycerol lysyltransferase domain-containing protein [Bifidobacterium sp. ESL0732]|uniref:phosphatidylglycerol lysyltransferase domain-containing protein n=1 Tax=Bifidobacterium sp. ESL0732 TaxID=2983222 RepID=UPI0023F8A65D|nr:phosphatidylglycerol lysyltransferase domain-containing protein [Bifidobacterium sp. ESL0732]WEV64922.1 phosphatidylglycerol lysyltransferase domain-containing protein [Bifidobacterium sp. ESL0732]
MHNHEDSKNKKSRKGGPSSWTVLGHDLLSWMRGHLFAILVAAAFLVVNIFDMVSSAIRHLRAPAYGRNISLTEILLGRMRNGGKPGGPFQQQLHSQDIIPWLTKILRSAVFVRSPLMLIIYTLLIVVILAVAQSRLGALKTTFAALFSAIIGSTLGLLVCVLVDMAMHDWQSMERLPVLLSPLTIIIGALMAESAYESVLWRRRILLLGYTVIGTLLLFSGNPGDYCTLGAAIVGQLTGLLMHGPIKDHIQWANSSNYEIRRLFAFAQLVLAVGPLLALTSTSHLGPLTTFGLFTSSIWGDSSLLTSCSVNQSVTSCMRLVATRQHLAIAGLWLHMLLPIAALALVAWGLYHGRRLAAWVSIVLNGAAVVFSVIYYVVFPLTVTPISPNMAAKYNFMPAFITTALPPLVLIILMLRELPHFSVSTGTARVRNGIIAMVGMLLITSGVYIGFAVAMPQDFKPRPTVKLLIMDMLRRLLPTGFGGRKSTALIVPQTTISTLISEGLTVLFWLTVLIVFILWFRDNVTPDQRDRKKAEALIALGGESMSFMTTWEGNHYWFSSTGRSAIAYRVLHGIALTVTGPFGDPNEYMNDLREFSTFCAAKGWSPSFYAVHDDQRKELENMGWSSIQVGTEMVLDPSQWQTRGKKWQDIRTAINKAKRDGITDVLTTYDQAGFNIDQQIVDISEQWAQLKALPEMKFTLGGIEELRDDRVALLYAVDSEDTVLGVTSWLPTYRDGRVIGWTLDFMRHRTDSPNGIMEFLIARMAERLRDQGENDPANAVEFMSLSAAPLAGMGEKAPAAADKAVEGDKSGRNDKTAKADKSENKDRNKKQDTVKAGDTNAANGVAASTAQSETAGNVVGNEPAKSKADASSPEDDKNEKSTTPSASEPTNKTKSKPDSPSGTEIIEHALQIAADVLEPAYGFKSLFFFKKKFQPSPAPIYICYPDSAKLAQIGIAVVNAYVPELKPKQVVEIVKSMTATDKNDKK